MHLLFSFARFIRQICTKTHFDEDKSRRRQLGNLYMHKKKHTTGDGSVYIDWWMDDGWRNNSRSDWSRHWILVHIDHRIAITPRLRRVHPLWISWFLYIDEGVVFVGVLLLLLCCRLLLIIPCLYIIFPQHFRPIMFPLHSLLGSPCPDDCMYVLCLSHAPARQSPVAMSCARCCPFFSCCASEIPKYSNAPETRTRQRHLSMKWDFLHNWINTRTQISCIRARRDEDDAERMKRTLHCFSISDGYVYYSVKHN